MGNCWEINKIEEQLFSDVREIIDEARKVLSQSVNKQLTLLYWHIGNRINQEVLNNDRAAYGEQILPTLSAKLSESKNKHFKSDKT